MLVFGLDRGWMAEVDFDRFAHYSFTIKDLADPDGGVYVKEGDDDAAETLQRGPRMNWC